MTVFSNREPILSYCDMVACEDECKIAHICERIDGQFIDDEEACNEALAIICEENDPVNKPSHYTDGKIEVIDFIEDKKLGFHLGNAVKYIARAGKKDPTKEIEDLKKAEWYVKRRIKQLEEVG